MERVRTIDRARLAWGTLLATLLVVVAWDFLAATTFFGDDHLFLTYARHAPHPFAALLSDQHGGEYYRPLPMALWWLLVKIGGERHWIFSLFALALHTTCAGLTGLLARRLGLALGTAVTAAALFLVSPAGRETASWFSASTDLLATASTLGSIVCLLPRSGTSDTWSWSWTWSWSGATHPPGSTRDQDQDQDQDQVGWTRSAASGALAGLAFLSKESALVLPLLALTAIGLRSWRRVLPHALAALLYLVARTLVLHGAGGSGDEAGPAWARALQIASGLAHAIAGEEVLPQPILWTLGLGALAWAAWAPRHDRRLLFALLWVALAIAPLPAAGWVVGTRYFYLPAVGLTLLLASQLWPRGPAVTSVAVAALLALGSARAALRRDEIAGYQARVAAAADAVATGLASGHRLFHVRAGVKDLDLVLKAHPRLRARSEEFLVLADVPASFVQLPAPFAERTRFLRADPPLPPSGAYRFGNQILVGLARRQESPDLEVVVARLPELRFIQLVTEAGGVGWRDVTHLKVPAR